MGQIYQDLLNASKYGDLEKAKQAIEKGADVKTQSNYGRTPLHWASNNGHEAIVSLLLENGADVNAQTKDGFTPLHYGSSNGHKTIVSLLLEYGADMNVRNSDGYTPLHNASRYGHEGIVSLLLKNGADPTITNHEGKSPLQKAQENNKQNCVSAIEQFRQRRQQEEQKQREERQRLPIIKFLRLPRQQQQQQQQEAVAKKKRDEELRRQEQDADASALKKQREEIKRQREKEVFERCQQEEEVLAKEILHEAEQKQREGEQETKREGQLTKQQEMTHLKQLEKTSSSKFKTRASLDRELKRLQDLINAAKDSLDPAVNAAAEIAIVEYQTLLPLCQSPNYASVTDLEAQIASLEERVMKMQIGKERTKSVQELHKLKQCLDLEQKDEASHDPNEVEHKQKEAAKKLSRQKQQLAAIKKQDFANIRKQLRLVMEKKRRDPVEVSCQYIHEIDTYEPLGKGFFGIVSKGYDSVLGVSFALKKVDMQVFENASPTRIEGILNSFQNEMNILSKLDHPNIASLYGFYFDPNDLTKMCLIYELASNGSLDGFWKDDHQRRRLSNGRTRVRIAYEVAMVLRYMHEGLDWEAVCFHRDIKSANVCLDADFTVHVIDCGLSKYIEESEESFSSAGGIGTKGYICPDYNDGEINYESSCDVFSYGVFLCELITGKTSPSGRHGHYIAFEKKKTKALIDNADATVEWDDDTLGSLVELALECIKTGSELRPTIGNVVERLHRIVYAENMLNDDSVYTGNHFLSGGPKCRICGREGTKTYHCFGSTKHVHCGECLEDSLVRSMVRGESHKICCLKEGCDSRDFLIKEVEQYISRHTLVLYSLSSTMAGLKSMLHSMSSSKNELRLQAQLCAGNGLPCPRRFILIEADRDGVHPWRNPREWLCNAKSVKLFLYFVCSHSNELVSNESRIELRYMYEDLMKIAPAYNASLYLLQQTKAIVTGAGISLDPFKLKQMDEWSRELLDPNDLDVLDRARANGNMMKDSDAQQLIGPALSLIAEKAVEKENLSWRRELTEAFDFQEKEATFIKRDYQLESRYREWHEQPSHPLGAARAPNPERVWPQRPPMTDAIQRILTCPISGDIMQDPVILFPSGKTFDRKLICTWLLRNPTPRDPWTNEPLGRHMTYIENRDTRDTLICYLGEEAYVRYDDSAFKLQYQALWNATTYREIAAHLYGMNWKQIDWAEAQEMTSNANQDDAIIIGFKALLLHPEVFSSNRLHKDEDASRLEWERAEELGLSILADADNPNAWAQWIKGIHLDIVEQDYDVAKSLYRLAAEQGLALAQNSLGALYQDDELDDLAESYYEQASLQGHALAQYNLAVLCEEEGDLNRAQEYFQQAAAQGHIEAREAIENLSEGTDMEQVHE